MLLASMMKKPWMEWKEEEDGVVKWNSFERLDLGIIESTISIIFLFFFFTPQNNFYYLFFFITYYMKGLLGDVKSDKNCFTRN
jgi:hypothetical protein